MPFLLLPHAGRAVPAYAVAVAATHWPQFPHALQGCAVVAPAYVSTWLYELVLVLLVAACPPVCCCRIFVLRPI